MTFTKDNARQYAEILGWLAEDGEVECQTMDGGWVTETWLNLSVAPKFYRRHRILAKRLITVAELPPTCWVCGDVRMPALVIRRDPDRVLIMDGLGCSVWFTIEQLNKLTNRYSSDLKTWHSFEVEEPVKE